MPNDTTLVDENRRITQAWQRFLGVFGNLLKMASQGSTTQTWNTVTSADLTGASTIAQIAAFANETKSDINANAAASAVVDARLSNLIIQLKASGFMVSP